MTTNYFKVAAFGIHPQTSKPFTDSKTFFFNDRLPDQIRTAYDAAKAESERLGGAKLSVYKTPRIGGPWDGVQNVGIGIGTLAEEAKEPN